jgi:hypothetical protein
VTILPLVPWIPSLSVAVTVCTTPEVKLVVKTIAAKPFSSVRDVGAEKLPPLVLVHVTVRPTLGTGLPFESVNCAVIVAEPPAIRVAALEATRYFEPGPAMSATVALSESGTLFRVPLMIAVPVVTGAVSVAV